MLILYDNPFSPFARKVRMVLRFKGLEFRSIDALALGEHDHLAAIIHDISIWNKNPRVTQLWPAGVHADEGGGFRAPIGRDPPECEAQLRADEPAEPADLLAVSSRLAPGRLLDWAALQGNACPRAPT